MLLEPEEVERFFRLHKTLMFYVNRRLRTIPDDLAGPEDFGALSPGARLKVRDALLGRLDLIREFAEENPAGLSKDDLDTVRSWRHMVAGKFFVFRELKKYTVFLTAGELTAGEPTSGVRSRRASRRPRPDRGSSRRCRRRPRRLRKRRRPARHRSRRPRGSRTSPCGPSSNSSTRSAGSI